MEAQLHTDGFTLVVWKPWLQLDQFCVKFFLDLANILKQESWTWKAESKNFAFKILMEAWHYDVWNEL